MTDRHPPSPSTIDAATLAEGWDLSCRVGGQVFALLHPGSAGTAEGPGTPGLIPRIVRRLRVWLLGERATAEADREILLGLARAIVPAAQRPLLAELSDAELASLWQTYDGARAAWLEDVREAGRQSALRVLATQRAAREAIGGSGSPGGSHALGGPDAGLSGSGGSGGFLGPQAARGGFTPLVPGEPAPAWLGGGIIGRGRPGVPAVAATREETL